MGYLGNVPATSFETVRKQVSTTNSGTTITLDFPVTNVQDILVTVDAVVQSYDNYSITSGNILNLGGTLNNNRVEILYVGRTFGSVNAPDNSVTTAQLQNNAITTQKINDGAITSAKQDVLANPYGKQLFHVRDEKAQDTHGGASSAGANTRDLNTVKTNEITGASLSSNQVTLPAGTYYAEGSAPVYKANYTHCYLHNVTDSATELVGSTQYAINLYNGYQTGTFCGRFTISAQKTFEVRSYTLAGLATFGLGLSALDINISVFADLRIWRIS